MLKGKRVVVQIVTCGSTVIASGNPGIPTVVLIVFPEVLITVTCGNKLSIVLEPLPATLNLVTPGKPIFVLFSDPLVAITAPGMKVAGLLTFRL